MPFAVIETAPQFFVLLSCFLFCLGFGFPSFSRLLIGCCSVVKSEVTNNLLIGTFSQSLSG
jgi:hypothetical protein